MPAANGAVSGVKTSAELRAEFAMGSFSTFAMTPELEIWNQSPCAIGSRLVAEAEVALMPEIVMRNAKAETEFLLDSKFDFILKLVFAFTYRN